jgi:hypothetical protein
MFSSGVNATASLALAPSIAAWLPEPRDTTRQQFRHRNPAFSASAFGF